MLIKTKDAMVEADYVEKIDGKIVFFLRNRIVIDCCNSNSRMLDFMYSEISAWASCGDVVDLTLFDSRNKSWTKRRYLQTVRNINFLSGYISYEDFTELTWHDFDFGVTYNKVN